MFAFFPVQEATQGHKTKHEKSLPSAGCNKEGQFQYLLENVISALTLLVCIYISLSYLGSIFKSVFPYVSTNWNDAEIGKYTDME